MFNHQQLRCYQYALDVAKAVPTITNKWSRGNAYLDDQLKRASSSIVLNIAEGNARYSLKDRRRFFNIARASAAEVSSIFDIIDALDLSPEDDFTMIQDKLVQIAKMLYKLK